MCKPSLKNIVAVALLLCILCTLTACGSSSVLGTWIIKEYKSGNEVFPKDDISKVFGEDLATYFNDSTITFYSNGELNMYVMNTNTRRTYRVAGNTIEVYDENGTLEGSMLLVGQSIEVDYGNLVMVYEKK